MRKWVALTAALATAVLLAGCNTPEGQNAAGGALLGGTTGALVGGALSNSGSGALVGAVTGAAAGAMLGAASTPTQAGYAPPPRRCAEWYYDYYGNRVCRTYY